MVVRRATVPLTFHGQTAPNELARKPSLAGIHRRVEYGGGVGQSRLGQVDGQKGRGSYRNRLFVMASLTA